MRTSSILKNPFHAIIARNDAFIGSIKTILNHHYFEKVPTTLKFCGHNIEFSCRPESEAKHLLLPPRHSLLRNDNPGGQLQRFVMFHVDVLHQCYPVGSFSIMCPHPKNLDSLLPLQDLIH